MLLAVVFTSPLWHFPSVPILVLLLPIYMSVRPSARIPWVLCLLVSFAKNFTLSSTSLCLFVCLYLWAININKIYLFFAFDLHILDFISFFCCFQQKLLKQTCSRSKNFNICSVRQTDASTNRRTQNIYNFSFFISSECGLVSRSLGWCLMKLTEQMLLYVFDILRVCNSCLHLIVTCHRIGN